jgi:hypothetical protein
MRWIAFSGVGETDSPCPNCGVTMRGVLPSADHHSVRCPSCGTHLVVVTTTQRSFVIDLENAPAELQRFFAWSQTALDELEFITLLMTLEEMICSFAPGDRGWNAS